MVMLVARAPSRPVSRTRPIAAGYPHDFGEQMLCRGDIT
jgi:hypothetical protein